MARKSLSEATNGDAAAEGAPGTTAPGALTENEMRFLKAIFENMENKPDANWDNVAGSMGLKDAKCAKERFRQMSVRHNWRVASGPGPSPRKVADKKITKRATPRTPTKKAKSAAVVREGDDAEGDEKNEETNNKKNGDEETVNGENGEI